MRAPRMAVARADREAELRIARPGRVEVVYGVNDMVEAARNDVLLARHLKPFSVMAGLVPAIHAFPPFQASKKVVDGRDKRGHDGV
jgi:hypothetical protein